MKLALKIDVDTFRGTREGVPRLVELLKKYNAGATFLFSLGPDQTGRAIKRVFRPGFVKKVSRTSVLEHYGLKTLLYGTLLPAPNIGLSCADTLRSVRDAGFEVGVHCWNHIAWQDKVGEADAEWTEKQMRMAIDRFEKIFQEAPRVHGAAGWQMNRYAYRFTQRLGFEYASDTRGSSPFIPMYKAEVIACPQIPGNLPTLDELIGLGGITKDNVAAHILGLTSEKPLHDPVFTLHAELEGMKLLPVFEQLLQGWQAQGYELVSMRKLFESLNHKKLPHHDVTEGEIDGRSGKVALQGAPFLS